MRILAVCGIAALAALAFAATPPTHAQNAQSDAVVEAVVAYADTNSAPMWAAELAIADQTLLGDYLQDVGLEPGINADVWVDPGPDGQTITIRTHEPLVLSPDAAGLSAFSTVNWIEGDLVDAAIDDTVLEEILRIAPETQGMYVRQSDGVLVIHVVADSLDSRVESALRVNDWGYPAVEVEYLNEPLRDQIAVRGGAALNGCTAGFAAKTSGTIGIITAAHCGSSASTLYTGVSASGSTAATSAYSSNYGANADIAYRTVASGSNSLSNIIYAQSTAGIAVGNMQSAANGVTACHRGKVSGWKCGTTQLGYKPTYAGACNGVTCNSTFVWVSGAANAGGDSGGPWLLGGKNPIGVHKGGDASNSIYSQISYRPSGVSLHQ